MFRRMPAECGDHRRAKIAWVARRERGIEYSLLIGEAAGCGRLRLRSSTELQEHRSTLAGLLDGPDVLSRNR